MSLKTRTNHVKQKLKQIPDALFGTIELTACSNALATQHNRLLA